MKLTGTFNLAAKSKRELRGLYRVVFNKLADRKISNRELLLVLRLYDSINKRLKTYDGFIK